MARIAAKIEGFRQKHQSAAGSLGFGKRATLFSARSFAAKPLGCSPSSKRTHADASGWHRPSATARRSPLALPPLPHHLPPSAASGFVQTGVSIKDDLPWGLVTIP